MALDNGDELDMNETCPHSIILVRHGQTSYNAEHRMQGQTDVPLNTVGIWQAKKTAEALQETYVRDYPHRKQLVIASDLNRAVNTAKAFAQPLGLEVHTDKRLRERNFGDWEGLTPEEIQQQWPKDHESWMLSSGGEIKHGAESKMHVGQRGMQALTEWMKETDANTDLFVFSHGSWMVQTVHKILGLDVLHEEYASFGAIRNAHWVHFIPKLLHDHNIRWALLDYNRGPAEASELNWNNPII